MALIDPPTGQKMKIFNFKLGSKLDLHFNVKFNGESNGDGPKAQKPYLHPLYYMAFIDPVPYRHKNEKIERQKMLITMCLFWLE